MVSLILVVLKNKISGEIENIYAQSNMGISLRNKLLRTPYRLYCACSPTLMLLGILAASLFRPLQIKTGQGLMTPSVRYLSVFCHFDFHSMLHAATLHVNIFTSYTAWDQIRPKDALLHQCCCISKWRLHPIRMCSLFHSCLYFG